MLRRLPVEPLGTEGLEATGRGGDRRSAPRPRSTGSACARGAIRSSPSVSCGRSSKRELISRRRSSPVFPSPSRSGWRAASATSIPPPCGVLELLAVLGRRVDSRSLVGLVDHTPDELAAILERLAREHAVIEEERGRELTYEISHPLVAEAIYEGIGAGRRRRIHRQAGRGLVSAGRLGEAAPHFVRSAEPGDDEAVEVLRQAVRQAEEAGAFQEALTILASLVEILPAGDPRWEKVVDALSWEAQWVVDHQADGYAVLGIGALRAMDLALEGIADPARRAPVKLRLANFLAWGTGELAEAGRVCRDAAALFEEAGDRRGALLAAHELAWILGLQGDIPTLEDRARDLARIGEAVGDQVVRARAMRTVAWATGVRGRFEDCRAAMAEVIATARAQNDRYRLVLILLNSGVAEVIQGRTAESLSLLEEARAIAEASPEIGLTGYEIVLPLLAGDFRQALTWVRRGRAPATSRSADGAAGESRWRPSPLLRWASLARPAGT